MNANLVILEYLGTPFTWDKVLKVLRPLPNNVKNQRLLVHILYYFSFNYLGKISKTMSQSCYLQATILWHEFDYFGGAIVISEALFGKN